MTIYKLKISLSKGLLLICHQ